MVKLLSMYEMNDNPEPELPGGPEKTLDCDIAVLGGGGSGIVAAVRAAQLGANVIVVEKMSVLGGNSWYAGGLLTTYSRFQKALGMPDMTNEYFKKSFRHNKYTLDPSIFKRYIANTGTFFEWIVDQGLDSENIRFIWDAVAMVRDRTDPGYLNNPKYGPGLIGSNILLTLYPKLDELGITVLKGTKARSLTTDAQGAVTGLLADGLSESYRINAKAVILASGGFGGNPELLKRFLPQYFSTDNYSSHYCRIATTGEGILMAEDIGAKVGENMSVGMAAMSHIPGSYSVQCAVGSEKCIIVNKNGERFIAEDDVSDGEFAIDLQPEGLAYAIFDEELKRVIEKDITTPNPYGDRVPTIEEFNSDLLRENGEGKLCIAKDLAEAAQYIGATEQKLSETFASYNKMVDAGEDTELFKSSEHLAHIGSAPYYVIRIQRNFDVTMGGVSINSKLEALTNLGEPIAGLYVTGDAASNWMGKDYGPLFSSFAWAMNSGYIAAEEACSKHV